MHAANLIAASIENSRLPSFNAAFTLFIVLALCVSMSISQYDGVEPGSLTYWMLILPAVVLPASGLKHLPRTLVGPGFPLLALLLTAGLWHLGSGDRAAVLQLGLLVWVTAWVSSDATCLNVRHLVQIYLALVLIGILVSATTDLNGWGLIPGRTIETEGLWRVSFFPNIAYTGMLSLATIMVLTRNGLLASRYRFALLLAGYFLLFSFVRTALIAIIMYALLRWWFDRRPSPARLYWGALSVGFGINLAVLASPPIFHYLQEVDLISRLFLRGESQLTTEEIYQQLFRPWLWLEHFRQFWESPMLMGWGAFEFEDLKRVALIEGQEQGDTVSLLTRLLAAYGLPGLLFTIYLVSRLRAMANACDTWGAACFASVIFLTLQWGSVFHPTDGLFALFVLMAVRGQAAFFECAQSHSCAAVQHRQEGLR